MGAPGCPELLAKVASTCTTSIVSYSVSLSPKIECPRIEGKLLEHHDDGGAATRAIFGGAEASHDDDEGQS